MVCTAELFLTLVLHPGDRLCMARLNAMLWSRVARSDAPQMEGWRCAEASAPVMVRCKRRHEPVAGTTGTSSDEYTLCSLHGRSAILPDSRAVCTVLSLTPAAPAQMTASEPVGFEQWPVDEVYSALLNAAHDDSSDSVTYEMLGDIGLDFDGETALDFDTEGLLAQLPTEGH